MRLARSAALALTAGLAAASHASETPSDTRLGAKAGRVVPLTTAGVLYVNMRTGERSLTRYFDGVGKIAVPEITHEGASASLFDYWMCLDENPCWDDPRADGFGWVADAEDDTTGESPITEPVVGFDFGDLPFNSIISGIVLRTATLATESTDSNGDGTTDTGIDAVAAFYDALDESNRASVAPPTAVVRIESIPGNRGEIPNGFSKYDLVLDFGGEHFELGDSDGQNRGSLWLSGAAAGLDVSAIITVTECSVTAPTNPSTQCTTYTTPNPDADGLADFQYLQHYAFHATDDKVTNQSTYIPVAAPEGEYTTTTYTTVISCTSTSCTPTIVVQNTVFTADPLPQAQGVIEGFGIGVLGQGANYNSVDWSIAGCCFWFGGLDCVGYLDQINPDVDFDATWYDFNPYAQNAMGLLSNAPPIDTCLQIDLNHDGVLDNGDITAFVNAKLNQLPEADINGDGVCDNGDIGAFVSLFVVCTG